jgi:hypothetical protein
MNKPIKNWLFALLLTLPMVVFYLGYYLNHSRNLTPTGFITYDNVSYAAYAKEYLDHHRISLFYSNPLNDSGNYPAIYFQTQTIFLALLLSIGFAPGFAIVFFNWLGVLLSFRLAISIYDHLYPDSNRRKLFISFFCWGGGLLALACIPVALTKPMGNLDFLDRMFFIDPAWGWWGLNFGRGHFNSVEGYFHFLFLSGIICILKKRWNLSLLVSFILSLSHPFTGIEYLAIVTTWAFVEKLIVRNKDIPWKFVIGLTLIMAFHIFYYAIYLNRFPEHRSVSEQYSLNWRLRFFSMIPAYCLVGGLAIISLIRLKKEFFIQSSTRLFFCWLALAFFLANHEIFIKPMQPLHFTRGYVWTGLFLLGLPALHYFFQNERFKKYKLALIAFSILMFSDNFLWIINSVRSPALAASTGYLTAEQKSILQIIKNNSNNKTLVIGSDEIIPYMSTVYTEAYPWISHPFTTPFAKRKQDAYENFIKNNTVDPAWKNREVIFVFQKTDTEQLKRSQTVSFTTFVLANTGSYIVEKALIP